MSPSFRRLAVLLTFVSLSACSSTRYALRETADSAGSEESYFAGGLKFRKRQNAALGIALAFDRMRTGKAPEFRVTFTNLGKTAFDFDPASVACLTSLNGSTVYSTHAIDPEKAIALLEKEYGDLNMSGAEATASVLNSVSGILAVAANDREQVEASNRQAKEDEERDAGRRTEQGRIREELKEWRTAMVRKTTLRKGESVTGGLVCPTDSNDYDRIAVTFAPGSTVAIPYAFERYAIE